MRILDKPANVYNTWGRVFTSPSGKQEQRHPIDHRPVNELRLILIVLGIVIVLGLYLAGRRNKKSIPSSQDQAGSVAMPAYSEAGDASQRHAALGAMPDPADDDKRFEDLLVEYDEQVDWDNLDEMDTEWLEESGADINYDELMYQLNQGQPGAGISEYSGGYWQPYPRPGEKVFVSVRTPDSKKVNQAVNASQHIEPLVLVMHVLAARGRLFNGVQLQSAMRALGLSYGEMQLFHAFARSPSIDSEKRQLRVFSVANAVEPGHFDKKKLDSLRTPGVTLLMQLPGPIDNTAAFDWFCRAGRELAQKLDGVLCDESHNVMTRQCLNHMKDQVSSFNLKLQLSQQPSIH